MVKQIVVKAFFSSLAYQTQYNCGHCKPDKVFRKCRVQIWTPFKAISQLLSVNIHSGKSGIFTQLCYARILCIKLGV